jgi:hypothetical protein
MELRLKMTEDLLALQTLCKTEFLVAHRNWVIGFYAIFIGTMHVFAPGIEYFNFFVL